MALNTSEIVPSSGAPSPLTGLADDALIGLDQALAGQFVPDDELDAALGLPSDER